MLSVNDYFYNEIKNECPECYGQDFDKSSFETSCNGCGLVLEMAYPYVANANRSMETPLERANTLRKKRENGDSKEEIKKKTKITVAIKRIPLKNETQPCVPVTIGTMDKFNSYLCVEKEYRTDLPLKAEGYIAVRYRKG